MKNELNQFKREFQIFKKGVTDAPKWILSKAGEQFNRGAKISFYESLGYKVM